jgi:hypothetical protein
MLNVGGFSDVVFSVVAAPLSGTPAGSSPKSRRSGEHEKRPWG